MTAAAGVSPELTLRPSLSGRYPLSQAFGASHGQVSPELTLRPSLSGLRRPPWLSAAIAVSPELTLRPSLSERHPTAPDTVRYLAAVSPELTLRPSLSAPSVGQCRSAFRAW